MREQASELASEPEKEKERERENGRVSDWEKGRGGGWSFLARASVRLVPWLHNLCCFSQGSHTGYLAHKKTAPPWDPTVGLCLGS